MIPEVGKSPITCNGKEFDIQIVVQGVREYRTREDLKRRGLRVRGNPGGIIPALTTAHCH